MKTMQYPLIKIEHLCMLRRNGLKMAQKSRN